LDSIDQLEEFLVSLVANLGMRVIAGPLSGTEEMPDERYGHSCVIILAESHAALHTYPTRRSMFLDVFSCKPFRAAAVYLTLASFVHTFVVVEETIRDRGVEWSAAADPALQYWLSTRRAASASGEV
jgi:S-adenosylmethionine decarboxylase